MVSTQKLHARHFALRSVSHGVSEFPEGHNMLYIWQLVTASVGIALWTSIVGVTLEGKGNYSHRRLIPTIRLIQGPGP